MGDNKKMGDGTYHTNDFELNTVVVGKESKPYGQQVAGGNDPHKSLPLPPLHGSSPKIEPFSSSKEEARTG